MFRSFQYAALLSLVLSIVGLWPPAPVAYAGGASSAPIGVKEFGAGYAHSLIVSGDGTVWQVGGVDGSWRPVQVFQKNGQPLADVKEVDGGFYYSLALKNDGTVWGWGQNDYAQLGDGTQTEQEALAVQTIDSSNAPLTDIVQISAGGETSLAVKSDGTVWGWGSSVFDNLGDIGLNTRSYKAIQMMQSPGNPLTGVKQAGGNSYHSVVLKEDGTVWAWGYGGYGALGNGSDASSLYPVQVKRQDGTFLTDIVQIASHEVVVLALRSDGTVWSWGNNLDGNLGTGGDDVNMAVQVQDSSNAPLTDVTQISAGGRMSVALKSDGTVWWWGLQGAGYPKATRLPNVSGAVDISAADSSGFAKTSAGALWGWGWNFTNELGANSDVCCGIKTPVQVYPALDAVTAGTASIPADGTSTSVITVSLMDGGKNPLPAGEGPVVLQTTLGTIGVATDNGNGTYTAVLTSGTAAGTAVVTGTLNGSPLTGSTQVAFTPLPASAATTTIEASPASIAADGTSQSTLTVRLKDMYGNAISKGTDSVTLATTLGTLSAVTNHNNGTYTARLTAPTSLGTATVSGTLNGSALQQKATVAFVPGAASPSASSFIVSKSVLTANGQDSATITVRLRDAYGHFLTTGGSAVTINATSGTVGAVTDHNNGTYTAALTAPTTAGSASINVRVGGSMLTQTGHVSYAPGPASLTESSIEVNPLSLTANGTSEATVTVRLKDAYGNALLASGGTVSLNATSGTLGAVTNHNNGTYSAKLTAPTVSGTATVSGKLGSSDLAQTATVAFTPGPASASTSTVNVDKSSMTADGSSTAVVTVRLKDAHGNFLTASGGAITMQTTAGTLVSVTNHNDGRYTATLTAPTATGSAVISAKLGAATLAQTASVAFTPGPVSYTTSTIEVSPSSITANGTSSSVVTVRLKDAHGNPLAASGGTLTVQATAGTVGPVTDYGDGTYMISVTAPTAAGAATVSGKLNGSSLSRTATVTFVPGAAHAASSALSVSKASLTADGTSTSIVTVRLKDQYGNHLTASGGSVSLSTTLGALGPVTNHQDGTYTATLTAPTVTGTAIVSGKLGSADLPQTASVTFAPGAASASTSTLQMDRADMTADGSATATITVRLKDAFGNALTETGGTVAILSTSGTVSAVTDHRDGTYTATLTAPTVTGTAVISAKLNGMDIVQTATVTFTPGAASVETSTISASSASLTADGADKTRITIRLKDQHGNNLTSSGGEVTLSATAGTLSEVTDHQDGTYTAELTAPTTAGQAVISGELDGEELAQTAEVAFVPGEASITASTVAVDRETITADGASTLTITVQLKDAFGNRLVTSGGTVSLEAVSGTIGAVTDHQDGTYSAVLTSPTTTGSAGIAAKLDGKALTQELTVHYVPGDASLAVSTIQTDAAEVIADGSSKAVVTVQLKDAYGNNLTTGGREVTLSATTGALSEVTDHGDGTYTAELTAPTLTGAAVVSGKLDGEDFTQTVSLDWIPGEATVSESTLELAETTLTADGTSETVVTVRLKDAFGNALVSSGGEVTLYTEAGTLSEVTDHGDGTYTATLTAPTLAGEAEVSGMLNGTELLESVTVAYVPGEASPATSTLIVNPLTALADGRTEITVTVRLKDAFGNALTESGGTVELAATAGTLEPVEDHGDGLYTAIWKAPSTPGKAEVTGKLNGVDMTQSAEVSFMTIGMPQPTQFTLRLYAKDGSGSESIVVTRQDVEKGRILISTSLGEQGWNLMLSSAQLEMLNDWNPELRIDWETPAGMLQFALADIVQSSSSSAKEAQSMEFVMERLAASEERVLREQARKTDSKLAAEPFTYRLNIVGEQSGEFKSFSLAGSNVILSDSDIDPGKATVAAYDEKTGQFRFVPALFTTDSEGRTEVTLKGDRTGGLFILLERDVQFADLNDHWSQEDAELLANKLIVQGRANGRFAPEEEVTRAEFATLLVRALDVGGAGGAGEFTDVPENAWYAEAVRSAFEAGIIQGFADGTFQPDAPVTRQQMAVMLVRAITASGAEGWKAAADQRLSDFNDGDAVAEWAEEAVSLLVEAGILRGGDDMELNPERVSTRGEMAALLSRLLRQLEYLN
ncbi:invasin domain 3-containing protein [Paenibacillus soyae]|uniref:S-layer homology domain-containing protein n=1 Tax=Paenibacillus soyae TaxID=2969249 RepID=A0A9X2MSY5_9BACL|nr:invasin domain 3-containing protein [Paenibacillus soyae]MCR2805246.1 S-layer homology domain-containing protein [Paenibacillus soyae]